MQHMFFAVEMKCINDESNAQMSVADEFPTSTSQPARWSFSCEWMQDLTTADSIRYCDNGNWNDAPPQCQGMCNIYH